MEHSLSLYDDLEWLEKWAGREGCLQAHKLATMRLSMKRAYEIKAKPDSSRYQELYKAALREIVWNAVQVKG
jgi:hypothetical protein